MPWSIFRTRRRDASSNHPGPAAESVLRRRPRDWAALAPIQRIAGPPPLVAPTERFATRLVTRRRPPTGLGPLGHLRSAAAPHGTVIAMPVPRTVDAGPSLYFTPAHGPERGSALAPEVPAPEPGRAREPEARTRREPDVQGPAASPAQGTPGAVPPVVPPHPAAPRFTSAAAVQLSSTSDSGPTERAVPAAGLPTLVAAEPAGAAMPGPRLPRLTLGQARRLGVGPRLPSPSAPAAPPHGSLEPPERASAPDAPAPQERVRRAPEPMPPQAGTPEPDHPHEMARTLAGGAGPAPRPRRAGRLGAPMHSLPLAAASGPPAVQPAPAPTAAPVAAQAAVPAALPAAPAAAAVAAAHPTPAGSSVGGFPPGAGLVYGRVVARPDKRKEALDVARLSPHSQAEEAVPIAGGTREPAPSGVTTVPVPEPLLEVVQKEVGGDLGGATIERGPETQARARDLGALAFTSAGRIHLPPEHGDLDQPAAQALVAHELVHVGQQRRLGPVLPPERSAAGRRLEAQARRVEQAVRARPAVTAAAADRPAPRPSLPLARAAITRATDKAGGTAETGSGEWGPDGARSGAPVAAPRAAPPVQMAAPAAPPVQLAAAAPVLQRDDEPRPPAEGGGGQSEADLERLAGRLYDRIRYRLRNEFLVDRERAGLWVDLR